MGTIFPQNHPLYNVGRLESAHEPNPQARPLRQTDRQTTQQAHPPVHPASRPDPLMDVELILFAIFTAMLMLGWITYAALAMRRTDARGRRNILWIVGVCGIGAIVLLVLFVWTYNEGGLAT